MSPFNPNQHHRRSIRLLRYDYAQPGAYFVTICSEGRDPVLGEIADGQVHLTAVGRMVEFEWQMLPRHFENVERDAFVVMPNHLHGIIILSERAPANPPMAKRWHGTAANSLNAILQNFKSLTTRRANHMGGNAGVSLWQRDYYEHIIRRPEELQRIREYILNNPLQWEWDEENPNRHKR